MLARGWQSAIFEPCAIPLFLSADEPPQDWAGAYSGPKHVLADLLHWSATHRWQGGSFAGTVLATVGCRAVGRLMPIGGVIVGLFVWSLITSP